MTILEFVKVVRSVPEDFVRQRFRHPVLLQRNKFPVHRVEPPEGEVVPVDQTVAIDPGRFEKVLEEVADQTRPLAVFELDREDVSIGRELDSTICIPHYSISALHASFVETSEGRCVVDHDSRNGTYVAGERIPPETPTPLEDRTEVKLAALEFRYFEPASIIDLAEQMVEKMGGRREG